MYGRTAVYSCVAYVIQHSSTIDTAVSTAVLQDIKDLHLPARTVLLHTSSCTAVRTLVLSNLNAHWLKHGRVPPRTVLLTFAAAFWCDYSCTVLHL